MNGFEIPKCQSQEIQNARALNEEPGRKFKDDEEAEYTMNRRSSVLSSNLYDILLPLSRLGASQDILHIQLLVFNNS